MGAKRLLILAVCLSYFTAATALVAKDKENEMRHFQSLDQLKSWAKSAYLGSEVREIKRDAKHICVVLGDMASGRYLTDIRVYSKVKDEWVLILTREAVKDRLSFEVREDSLVFTLASGKTVLIVPFEGLD
jgi:hypothetical protein